MKWILILTVILIAVNLAYADELPEPAQPEVVYKFEIGWGTIQSLVWAELVPDTWIVVDMPPTIDNLPESIPTEESHVYWNRDNVYHFYAEAADSTEEQIRMLAFEFTLDNLPVFFFGFFRVRVIGYRSGEDPPADEHENWSEASNWVAVFKLGKMYQSVHFK